jgi:DnaJ-class molecular chaperone
MANTCRRCGQALVRCAACKGTGVWVHLFGRDPCTRCHGSGWLCPNTSHDANWQ